MNGRSNDGTVTYRIGEMVQRSSRTRSYPFRFEGNIGTAVKQIAIFDYDTIQVINDSAVDIWFSVDNGRDYFRLAATESITWDKCTKSQKLFMYAAAAGSAVRVALWQEEM